MTGRPTTYKTDARKRHSSRKSDCQGGPKAGRKEWPYNPHMSPITVHHMGTVFSIVRGIKGREHDDSLDDLDMNIPISSSSSSSWHPTRKNLYFHTKKTLPCTTLKKKLLRPLEKKTSLYHTQKPLKQNCVGWLVGWLLAWLAGWLVLGWLVLGWLVGAGWLAGWLVLGWLVGWWVGWWVDWLWVGCVLFCVVLCCSVLVVCWSLLFCVVL